MLKFLLGLAVGFTLAKLPAEFWAQMRAESVIGMRAAWEWAKAKAAQLRKRNKPQ